MIEAWKTTQKIKNGETTSTEVVEKTIKKIEDKEPQINAYITVEKEKALEKAREIDRLIEKNEDPGMLAGIPVGMKDAISTAKTKTTCGSKTLKNYKPPYDAYVVEQIKNAGGIIIGKTNCDEFCMGSTTETSYFGATKNPINPELVPGGSSGGSAAAVKYGGASIALGSDTGGSVRCPAAFCSLVGLKPTYGHISRHGLVAYASSLDQIGPITTNVKDAALTYDVISGKDPNDPTSTKSKQNHYQNLKPETEVTLGIPKELMEEGINPDVKNKVKNKISDLEDQGANIKTVSIPSLEYALPAYCIISMSEASSNLARYDGVRYGYTTGKNDDWNTVYKKTRAQGFGDEVKRRIILGSYALSAGYYDRYYNKALKIRQLLKKEFEKAFNKVDALIAPTMPYKPFKIGEKIDDPLSLYMGDALNVPVNMIGSPSITIPTSHNEPVGIQIIGNHHQEQKILNIAYAMEETK
ncbi:Asp-tRNA(Asn)/Glu-tRNA(Gln) amidotransferase subunit GatA [Methanonatronarchaeum sp. AMET-Sl]|uniref:Asp-tRNA(Asn)/Glu-tRNA(Gln) amidotransferase subunit GatA n=1 Tax=Methanonatronarchaeum sp. AMET-Sl TaxID=3037654 RepID=UPI00244DC32D|nr:Asp-tRNA(Asn)/Glu-tRNA(Gln) amidotransferase subunit GatA [Methanonatronarchaeum sp. AMET-Sl]WGI16939.1 Asp-tRNA(Asn)/Glu-tRNA(Gln) amidotransferase subunit GatA [Methanonatronarchaeum sp. AMET-Sl]